MSGEVFTSALANTLRKTLDRLPMDSYERNLEMPMYFEEGSMDKAFEDDLAIAGPGLLSEKPEGTALSLQTIAEGALTRYYARTYGGMLIISQEAMEDVQYKEAIAAGKMLLSSAYQTVNVDAALMLTRAWSSSYTFGDGQAIFSASHTLAHGGTFSNTLAVPMTPSRAALIVIEALARHMPGHNGVARGYKLKRIVCPVEQRAAWAGITNSTHNPEAGQFNEINTVNHDMKLEETIAVTHWDSTSTNYLVQTDAENGFLWKWRIRPKGNSWVNNEHTEMRYGVRARWARGMTDPRCAIGSQA